MLGTVRHEPALSFLTVAYAIVGLVVSFAHLTTTQAGYLTAIVGAVATILVAAHATPRNVAAIGAGVSTILASLVVFHLRMSSEEIRAIAGAVVVAVGLLGGFHLRGHLMADYPPAPPAS